MTEVRWEYAAVVWTESARKITKTDPESEELSPEVHREWAENNWPFYWWKTQTYYVWLPGAADADVRHSWKTGETEYKITLLAILNELGAEGWEAFSESVKSTAMGSNLGRTTTGFPIHVQTLLKRPLAEP